VRQRDGTNWDDLAQREPYFPVLTADGRLASQGCAEANAEFFATGEADVSTLLMALKTIVTGDLSLESVLDFGCGAGRLTLPLARRARRVVACDIAPTMLAHARENVEGANLANVQFILSDELTTLTPASFSFICSLAVFQHVPASLGYGAIRSLARLLAPGGVAAIQLCFGGPITANRIRRMAAHRTRRTTTNLPFATQTNVYNEGRVVACLKAAGVQPIARLPIGHRDRNDSVLIVRRTGVLPRPA
jgi:SAM-dependent methyltransferase